MSQYIYIKIFYTCTYLYKSEKNLNPYQAGRWLPVNLITLFPLMSLLQSLLS